MTPTSTTHQANVMTVYQVSAQRLLALLGNSVVVIDEVPVEVATRALNGPDPLTALMVDLTPRYPTFRLDRLVPYTATTVPMVPVQSSNIRAVGYDPLAYRLWVAFHNGRVYEYQHVPPALHRALLAGDNGSIGRAFNRLLRDNQAYPQHQVQ